MGNELGTEEKEDLALVIPGVLATLLITVEIVLILKKKNFKPFEKLLLSLGISDLLVTITVTIFKIIDFSVSKTDLTNEDKFFVFFAMSLTFSTGNILVITIDRFLAVRFPIKHRVLMTGRRTNKLIFVLWTLCGLSTVSVAVWIFVYKNNMFFIFAMVSITLLLYGILLLIVYIYIAHASISRKAIIVNSTGSVSHKQAVVSFFSPQYKAERSIFYTCFLVALAYVLCSFPFAIEMLIVRDAAKISFGAKLVLFLNSAMNPIVYFFKGYLERRKKETPGSTIPLN